MPAHIGKPEISTCMPKRETFVIETEQMQNGGMQVVHMDFVFYRLEAKLVGLSVGHSAFYSSSSEPHRETVMIVISSISIFRRRRSTELTSPYHQRIVQQSSLFQVA